MKAAIREDNPVFFVQHKRLGRIREEVPEGDYEVPIGKAKIVREGKDITIVATSFMVHEALAAADRLKERGIEAEVVDPRTLVPMDIDTIVESVKKTHRVVVAHEAVRFCGIGAEIASQITERAFDYLDGPPLRIGAPFEPGALQPRAGEGVGAGRGRDHGSREHAGGGVNDDWTRSPRGGHPSTL